MWAEGVPDKAWRDRLTGLGSSESETVSKAGKVSGCASSVGSSVSSNKKRFVIHL